jgi:PhnB protein
MAAKPVPENSSVVIPRLFCRDLVAEIEFLKAVFGADDPNRRPGPDGKIIHALLTIRGQMLMLEAEYPTLPSRVPLLDGSSPVVIFVYVEDVDRVVEKATSLGATLLIPVKDQFWGDRIGWIMDPEGHVWTIATRIEETTADQRSERWEKIRTS